MPSTAYLVSAVVISAVITFALRGLPFLALGRLHSAPIVQRLAVWMPVGILAILAATTLRGTIVEAPGTTPAALLAVTATIAVHLALGRRTIISVATGTAVYVALANLA